MRFSAGYQGTLGAKGNVGVIFDGHIRDVAHKRDQTDIITTIECGDGDKGVRQGAISKSYPAGTKPKKIIEDILKQMPDVEQGSWEKIDELEEIKRPWVACGSCRRELDKLGRTHNFYWSIQDGALEIIPGDGYIDDVVVISPKTGMIGVPTLTDNGIRVECLLNPQLRCNRVVEVRSETLEMNGKDSRYRISGLTFSGDNGESTEAGDFTASIVGEAIHSDKVDEGREKDGSAGAAEQTPLPPPPRRQSISDRIIRSRPAAGSEDAFSPEFSEEFA